MNYVLDSAFLCDTIIFNLDRRGVFLLSDDAKKEKRKWKRWQKNLLIAGISVVSVLLLLVGAAWLYVNHLLNKINYTKAEDYTLSMEEVEQLEATNPDYTPIGDDEDVSELPKLEELEQEFEKNPSTIPEKMPDPNVKGNVVNILLIGQDRRGEARARSDSMILLTINKSKETFTLTSFMRDAYVQIPGYKPDKLNAAFQWGGFTLLNQTLWVNYGVRVDGNLEVDFNRFMSLIDLLGGVDIDLTQAEVDYLTGNGKKWPELKAGMNHLNGDQALQYSRIRYIDTDYRRAERQRTVLFSLFNTYRSKSLPEMLVLLEDILPLVTTNMEKSDIWDLARDVFPIISDASISNKQIPAHGTFKGDLVVVRDNYKGWFQYDIDFEANRKILQEIFAEG